MPRLLLTPPLRGRAHRVKRSPSHPRKVAAHWLGSHLRRTIDLLLAWILLLFTLPPLLLALCLLACSQGFPLFYRQQRRGRDGRRFWAYKLRTMSRDASEELQALLQDPLRAAEWKEHHKLCDDPRVTSVGRWLRRYSLDELPQLWNVLRGDMSLIGPRPMTPEEARSLDPAVRTLLFQVRPGISGRWQTTRRHTSTFEERVIQEADYVQHASWSEDLCILLRTLLVVARGTGC